MDEKQIGLGMFQLSEDGHILGFDRRWIFFSTALLTNILNSLNDIIGPVAKRRVYEIGYESGRLAGERVKPFFGGGIEQYKKHLSMLHAMGWGITSKVDYEESTGKIVVEFPDSWPAHGYKELHPNQQTNAPMCYISAGLASGAAEGAFGIPYEGEEVNCVSKGDAVCRLVLTPRGETRKVIK